MVGLICFRLELAGVDRTCNVLFLIKSESRQATGAEAAPEAQARPPPGSPGRDRLTERQREG